MLHKPKLARLWSGSTSFLTSAPRPKTRWMFVPFLSFILILTVILGRNSRFAITLGLKRPKPPPPPPWTRFGFMERYNGGLRTLVAASQHKSEYPNSDERPWIKVGVNAKQDSSIPLGVFDPYPDYASAEYSKTFSRVETCYLDEQETTPVPRVQVYQGAVQGFADPIIGSHQAIGVSGSHCYDRFGRLGPYGYGYSKDKGGTGAGLDDESEGADQVWRNTNQVDYRNINWAEVQDQCLRKNQHRFNPNTNSRLQEAWRDMGATAEKPELRTSNNRKRSMSTLPRTAVIIRTWYPYTWTNEAIVYIRSLISELSLLSGAEYQVHLLVHVKNDSLPIWASDEVYNQTLQAALPAEFQGMGTLWSEAQMGLIYKGLQETAYNGRPVNGVLRSAHFPLQYFSLRHPEYEYFWNWEMDIRYTGHWYELFESMRSFARDQPRKGLWEQSERFYIPKVHGDWHSFQQSLRSQYESHSLNADLSKENSASEPSIWHPQMSNDSVAFDEDPSPPTTYAKDNFEWGVGEDADLITLNPLFDVNNTGWAFAYDVTGYPASPPDIPRRAALITASRLSKRLLQTMHKETIQYRHTMFAEMFPATTALYHGLKAVYAPHPVYIDRAWPPGYLDEVLNSGPLGASGGAEASPFNLVNEHNFRGVTWYFNSGFPANLWRRWLGLMVNNDGGKEWEMRNEGRMCLPAMLLHPVKDVEFKMQE